MDQLPRLGKRELICLLLFTCNYVASVWRGFLFLWVLGMGYVSLLWQSLSLPYNYFLTAITQSECVSEHVQQCVYKVTMCLPKCQSLISSFNYTNTTNSIHITQTRPCNTQHYYTTRYIVSNDIFLTMSRGCIDYACH